MSKKEKDYKKRLKHIHEDVLKLSKCLPDIDYNESMYDWESINRFISDIEVASDIKNNESVGWVSGKVINVPTHDPQTGELNPYFEELTGLKNPLLQSEYLRKDIMKGLKTPPTKDKDLDKMPNQKWHQIVSFIKSGVRIVGYCFIPFNLVVATVLLVFKTKLKPVIDVPPVCKVAASFTVRIFDPSNVNNWPFKSSVPEVTVISAPSAKVNPPVN